jgi:hypothetical protein
MIRGERRTVVEHARRWAQNILVEALSCHGGQLSPEARRSGTYETTR